MRISLDGRYVRDDFPGIGQYVYNLAWTLPAMRLVSEVTTRLALAGHEDPRYPQARERAAALGLDSVMSLGRELT